MSEEIVVVLGKASFRKAEETILFDFGRALALRGKQLLTTKSDGAVRPIRAGFEAGGGKVDYLKPGTTEPFDGRYPVIVFTDKRMQDELDKRMPDWRERDWTIIHNQKETETAGRYTRTIMRSLGTPLPDGG